MNKMKIYKRLVITLCLMLVSIMFFTGCGKKDETVETAEKITETETAEETPEQKRAHFTELYKENALLWNDYNDILQEIAYYESVYHEDLADQFKFKTAEEKLNQTREDNPLRFRPVKEFHTEVGEIEIPEVTDAELDKWISDLTEQNATIKEQSDLLIPTRDALKDKYGVVMNLDGLTIAEETTETEEQEATDAGKDKKDKGGESVKDSDKKSSDSVNVSADGTVEQILKSGGWQITYGSGDFVEATKTFGDDEFYFSSQDFGGSVGLNVEIRSISYGELSGMNTVTDIATARKVAAVAAKGNFNSVMNYPIDWRFYNGG
ncbi:MAG: hypothetical protein K5868_04470 [Lachnospiraceae bacterium]|nr:hypothetical protein [Lachnospiraceae bacterium]